MLRLICITGTSIYASVATFQVLCVCREQTKVFPIASSFQPTVGSDMANEAFASPKKNFSEFLGMHEICFNGNETNVRPLLDVFRQPMSSFVRA